MSKADRFDSRRFFLFWWFAIFVTFNIKYVFGNGPAEREFLLNMVYAVAAGVSQWLVLRPYLRNAGWWGVLNAFPIWLGATIFDSLGTEGAGPLLVLVAALALGFLPWLILRSQVARAAWWIVTPLLAAMASVAVTVAVTESLIALGWIVRDGPAYAALDSGVYAAVYGLVTGFVLLRLLRQPMPEAAGRTATA